MEELKWTIMHVNKKDLDGWLAKKLMKLSLRNTDKIHFMLSSGAYETLRHRRKELSENTLKLVVLSGLKPLIEIMLDELSLPLLKQLAKGDSHDMLDRMQDKEKFAELVPTLLEHKNDLDTDIRDKIIDEGGVGACEAYKDLEFMQQAILESKHCSVQLFYDLLQKHPKYAAEYNIHDILGEYVAEGKIKLVKF